MKILYVPSYISRNGGVQSVVNNYYNHMNLEENQIDFLTLLPGDKDMEEEWAKKGCNIYKIKGSEEKNLYLFYKEIKKFFKEHHDYDVIHSHQTNLDIFYLREAKRWKIPVRILHAHSTNCDISKFRMLILRLTSKIYANYFFACSEEAGSFMFGKNIKKNKRFYVISNAIEVEKYAYNSRIREEQRKENNIENNFVIGNVARMVDMKNHDFLLKVFKEILIMNKEAKLLLIGNGPLEEKLKKETKELEIDKNVIFYGVTNKVNDLLQAMDVFVLPSLFEGVPLTVIEAAASGTKYVISDKIDSHLKKNDLELKISLDETPEFWAKQILKFAEDYTKVNQKELLIESKFDIATESNRLEKIYQEILKGENKYAKQ